VKIRVGRPAIRVPGFRFAGAACGLKQNGSVTSRSLWPIGRPPRSGSLPKTV
jgi:hypothetical protein